MILKYFQEKNFLFVASQKIAQSLYGIILIILVNSFFDLKDQGIFYLMSSLLASYILFDFGLSNFLVQKSTINMMDKKIQFENFKSFILQIYLIFGIFLLILIPLGLFYFNIKIEFDNFVHWIIIVITASVSFPFLAYTNLIEAKNLKLAYKLRILSHFLATSITVFFFFIGEGFLSLTSFFASNTLIIFFYIVIKDLAFIKKIKILNINKSYWLELIKNQKKVFLFFIGFYIFFNFPILVSFYIFDEIFSGKIGLTVIICNVLLGLSNSHLTSFVPIITKEIQKNNPKKGKNIFKKYLIFSFILTLIILFIFILLQVLFEGNYYLARIVDFENSIFIFLSIFILYLINNITILFRAFKIEIFYKELIIISILMSFFSFFVNFENYQMFILYYFSFVFLSFLSIILKILCMRY